MADEVSRSLGGVAPAEEADGADFSQRSNMPVMLVHVIDHVVVVVHNFIYGASEYFRVEVHVMVGILV